MKHIKKVLTIGCSLLALQTAIAATTGGKTKQIPSPKQTPVVSLDRIIAIVNNQVITSRQLSNAIQMAKRQMRLSNTPIPNAQQLHDQALNLLINQTLQLQLAKRAGMSVSDSELENALTAIAGRNHATLSQMRNSLASQGINYRDFREQIKRQILISKVQQGAVGSKITISPQEIKAMREQASSSRPMSYHLGDILITMPDSPTAKDIQKAHATAKALLIKLRSGQSFKAIAAAHSDASSSVTGGDLGWKTLPELPEIFANAVQHRLAGSIVGPIQAPNGLHILKIINKRQDKNKQISTDQIKQMIWQRKFSENLEIWMQQLRNNTYIKIEK